MKFKRRTWRKYSKLGKGRRRKQVWRRPTGRDNKMREGKRGAPKVVKIGYGSAEKKRIMTVRTLKDAEKISEKGIVAIGKVGKKKKVELAEALKKKGIRVQNLNIDKFLELEAKKREKKEAKTPVKKKDGEESKTEEKGKGDKK